MGFAVCLRGQNNLKCTHVPTSVVEFFLPPKLGTYFCYPIEFNVVMQFSLSNSKVSLTI